VREILPEVNSLSSKFELVTDVGYREGPDTSIAGLAAGAG
jgi:hypothetical protein